MRHARVLVLAALAVPVIAAVAFAQSAVTPIPDPPPVRIAPLEVDLSKT
ncbi:cytochrome c4, partial [Xanthomonas hortorum pv. gardneri]